MSFIYAKSLAKAAGLPVKTNSDINNSEMDKLSRWFSSYSAEILEEKFSQPDTAYEAQLEQQYVSNRSMRYRTGMQVTYARQQTGCSTRKLDDGRTIKAWRVEAEIPGFYEWQFGGKSYKSWMGQRNLALLPPKAIGGYLSGRYQGYDVTIVQNGVVASRQFVVEGAEPIVCPKYTVSITKKLPGWYLTAERLLLQGLLMDRDAAKELWNAYESNELTQQEYSEKLATLCRHAEKFDDIPDGWVDIDDSGRFIERPPEDRPSAVTDDPYRDHEEMMRLWENPDEEFNDLEDDRSIALMLGMSTEQIEHAGDVADTTEEFLRAAWTLPKPKKLPEQGEEIEGW